MKRFTAAVLSIAPLLMAAVAAPAHATQYPVTVTDTAGRSVVIQQEPKRVVIQDGRDILTMALLDRSDPFQRVVAWNNLIARGDPGLWKILSTRWPDAKSAVDMKFSDQGNVNLESVISKQPQLIIAQLRAKPAFEQSHVLERMAQLKIPVVFVDSEQDPIGNTTKSVALLGTVLNREKEAKDYVDFYNDHLQHLRQTIAAIPGPRPRVFVEAKAGFTGGSDCCFTHATMGWGRLLQAVDAHNVGADLLHVPSGDVTLESLIGARPDVYIMTGANISGNNNTALPFGYDTSTPRIDAAFAKLMSRPGFKQLKAAQDRQVYGIYHLFYNHAYNIVGAEYLAKILYPAQFAALDPTADWNAIITRFTRIPTAPLTLEAKAPAQ
ncbi:MAG: ABC transporter substrate-binding protein [Janthinobacterium lividum]